MLSFPLTTCPISVLSENYVTEKWNYPVVKQRQRGYCSYMKPVLLWFFYVTKIMVRLHTFATIRWNYPVVKQRQRSYCSYKKPFFLWVILFMTRDRGVVPAWQPGLKPRHFLRFSTMGHFPKSHKKAVKNCLKI